MRVRNPAIAPGRADRVGESVEAQADAKDETMTRSPVIEDESGTCRGHVHPHNGYYAGDFSTPAPIIGWPDAA